MITKRSIVVKGGTTSISMEPIFWEEVDRRAREAGVPWQDYMRKLLDHIGKVRNRSSALREALFSTLKSEFINIRKAPIEKWWLISDPTDSYEVGTRCRQLFVGHTASNDIVIDDSEVSQKHLMLCWDGENWWGIDLGSRSGTHCGGRPVDVIKLHKGMVLHLGKSSLTLLN
jgi:predicted DNA-binding ribbon-helix-helix protein